MPRSTHKITQLDCSRWNAKSLFQVEKPSLKDVEISPVQCSSRSSCLRPTQHHGNPDIAKPLSISAISKIDGKIVTWKMNRAFDQVKWRRRCCERSSVYQCIWWQRSDKQCLKYIIHHFEHKTDRLAKPTVGWSRKPQNNWIRSWRDQKLCRDRNDTQSTIYKLNDGIDVYRTFN